MHSGNYQDDVTAPLVHNHDKDATADNDPKEDLGLGADAGTTHGMLPAVERVIVTHSFAIWAKHISYKLWKTVRAVHLSPQCCQSWAHEIQFVQLEGSKVLDDCSASLMLILGVRTWWASTHQMLCTLSLSFILDSCSWTARWVVNYCDTIDSFISRNKDLHALELSNSDWESIKLVVLWLKSFRSATIEMSVTKTPNVVNNSCGFSRLTGWHQRHPSPSSQFSITHH